MATIKIVDPVTRIEGHMRIEVEIDQNKVVDARSTGTLFRGFETILQGRHAWDAPLITQRICGVCPTSHSYVSAQALDNAAGRVPPANARILRNLELGANFIQSHILHFYILAAADYVRAPQSSPWIPGWDVDMRSDPALDGVIGNLATAVEARRLAHELGAIFGGKMPLAQSYIPGGFTAVPNAARIADFRSRLAWLIDFIKKIYLPDIEAVGQAYPDYFSIGVGYKNLLAYGIYDLNSSGSSKLLSRGYVDAASPNTVQALNVNQITESVTYSWYNDSTNNLNPASGETLPVYPKGVAYSWLKAPRYSAKPSEVGPLARMWVNGDYRRGVSVMDRHLSRGLETLKVAEAMNGWLDELAVGAPVYDGGSVTLNGTGIGLGEAPRGALGHWVSATNGTINHYQIITPTCWNASPRDTAGLRGPMEQSLIGTPIEDPEHPIEALRVIHSFDPCLSCAVHVMSSKGKAKVIHSPVCGCGKTAA